jgi:SAM-dependent methyltransferase
MAFDVTAEAYGRFMGRFSEPLAGQLADLAGVAAGSGQQVLDVGCGPGALTAELVDRLGAGAIAAVDPSTPFVAAARDRLPAVDVRRAAAEELPYPDDTFDTALAQLVVHFMADPVAGLREMARVTRPGGVVAACVWDFAGERAPLTTFWRAVGQLDAAAADESGLGGARAGHLAELAVAAGLVDVEPAELTVRIAYPTFDDWWEPYTLGVGPAGDHVAGLDAAGREALRARCADLLPPAPIDVEATAWAVRATVA